MKFSDLHNPAAAAKVINEFKKRHSAKICLSPSQDCEGAIVSAHTLSVASMLRPLSKVGKVYALKPKLPPPPGEPPMQLALRGLRETSVFNGFCDMYSPWWSAKVV